jgi:O-antigen ligase
MVIIILLPFFIFKYRFPVKMLYLYIPLLISGLLHIYLGNNTVNQFLKIFINILVSSLFYYYVFNAFKFQTEKLFNWYLKGALIVSIIGIIQIISYKIGFVFGYDYSPYFNKWQLNPGGIGIRLNAIFSEPSYFANTISPAFFVALYNVSRKTSLYYYNRIESILIILAYFLTYSTVAYIGIFVSIILLTVSFGFIRYFIFVIPIVILGYNWLYNNVTEFRTRVDGLERLYSNEAKKSWEVHGSSFVQYNNTHIAFENFKRNPLFGTGLGSHAIAFDKYSLHKYYGGIYSFNKQDANSMALRLLSETGLFGIIFIIMFLYKSYIGKLETTNFNYWIISNACLVIIILQLARQGNYTYNGFFFFMYMYYFNKNTLTVHAQNTLPLH